MGRGQEFVTDFENLISCKVSSLAIGFNDCVLMIEGELGFHDQRAVPEMLQS